MFLLLGIGGLPALGLLALGFLALALFELLLLVVGLLLGQALAFGGRGLFRLGGFFGTQSVLFGLALARPFQGDVGFAGEVAVPPGRTVLAAAV